MVFKNFRFQVVIRVVILVVIIGAFVWCLIHERFLRSFYLGAALIIAVVEFVWYVDRFNRDVKTFMISLLQHEFNTHYQAEERGKSFSELYEMLNKISAAFMRLSTEKEIQHRYLELLVEHLRVGILSLDADGKIHLANQAVKNMFRKNVLTSLKSIASVDPALEIVMTEIGSGETRLMKLRIGNGFLELSMHASEFKLEGKYYKLISIQDIRNELDAKEIEAWQKLIRVLSHEIMNSVAPIISLSATLHTLVRNQGTTEAQRYQTLDSGLEAIKIRSEGLYNFTQSYRKLTGMPRVSRKQINLKELMTRVHTLMQPRLVEQNIAFDNHVLNDVWIDADPELLEHVLINLITNAMDALHGKRGGTIRVNAAKENEHVAIRVADNGEGIDEAVADKIFIPFFTTRKTGTGIGLALSKQILQLHHADIHFTSQPGSGTEFVIAFNLKK